MHDESSDSRKLIQSLTAEYWEKPPAQPQIIGLALVLAYFCFGLAHWAEPGFRHAGDPRSRPSDCRHAAG